MAKVEDFSNKSSQRVNRYFSESFKRKKVREIEKNVSTVLEVSREYEVSTTAVYKWLDKYSHNRKRGVKQVVELMSDTRKIQELRNKIRDLEQLVGQKQFEIEFKNKMIDIAEEMYDIDIKKKLGSQPLPGSGSTAMNTDGK
ncbi:transposase [Aequorivita vladivostokensis]|nr:transposase [Aequorivita vladivostokensis]MBF29824.1 transposase [Aequorivita sp.]MBF31787.1 transposase [Aequorivita sp.]|tara:strand:- start:1051 stop:1476 length:426 start_codon:yes stop_codon:yes gene_type:complete